MSLVFTETDTSATFDVACSGATAGVTTAARTATVGGTAGSSEVTVDTGNNVVRAIFAFELGKPGANNWRAGTWTVRVNITTQDGGTTLEEVHVCDKNGGTYVDVDSGGGGTQATALGITGTGVKTVNVTQSNDHTPQSAADSQPYIVLVFENTDLHGTSSTGITPSENIDTPIAEVIDLTAFGGESVPATHQLDGAVALAEFGGETVPATHKVNIAIAPAHHESAQIPAEQRPVSGPDFSLATKSGQGTGDISFSHAHSGTPDAAFIEVVQRTNADDEVLSVLYGGVPARRIATAAVTSGKQIRCYLYAATEADAEGPLPANTQTVDVKVKSGSTNPRVAVVKTVTTGTGVILEDVASHTSTGGTAVSVALSTQKGTETFVSGFMGTGEANPANLTEEGSLTLDFEHDFGTRVGSWVHKTTNPAGGAVSVNWTLSGSETFAAIAVAWRDGRLGRQLLTNSIWPEGAVDHTGATIWTDFPENTGIHSDYFVAGRPYLVLARARIARASSGDGTSRHGVRVNVTGGSALAESQFDRRLPSPTNSAVWSFCKIRTFASGEGLQLQGLLDNAANTVRLTSAAMVAIDLSKFRENVDYFTNERSTDDLLSMSWTDGASITFTPAEPGDYLVLGYEQLESHASDDTVSVLNRLLLDGSPEFGQLSKELRSSQTQDLVPFCWPLPNLSAASHTVKLQASAATGSIHTRLHSELVILRAAAFRTFTATRGLTGVNVTNVEYGNTLLSDTFELRRSGPMLFFNQVVADGQSLTTPGIGRNRIRIDPALPSAANGAADTEDAAGAYEDTDRISNVLWGHEAAIRRGQHWLEMQTSDNPGGGDGNTLHDDYSMIALELAAADSALQLDGDVQLTAFGGGSVPTTHELTAAAAGSIDLTLFGGESVGSHQLDGAVGLAEFGGETVPATHQLDGEVVLAAFGGETVPTPTAVGVVTLAAFGGESVPATHQLDGALNLAAFGGETVPTHVLGGTIDLAAFGGESVPATHQVDGAVTLALFGGETVPATHQLDGTIDLTAFGGESVPILVLSEGDLITLALFGGESVPTTHQLDGAVALTAFGGESVPTPVIAGVVTLAAFGGESVPTPSVVAAAGVIVLTPFGGETVPGPQLDGSIALGIFGGEIIGTIDVGLLSTAGVCAIVTIEPLVAGHVAVEPLVGGSVQLGKC